MEAVDDLGSAAGGTNPGDGAACHGVQPAAAPGAEVGEAAAADFAEAPDLPTFPPELVLRLAPVPRCSAAK